MKSITFNLSIDPTSRTEKPSSDKEKGKISKNLTLYTGVTVEQFSELVLPPYSFSWSPAVYNGSRNNKNWVSQQIFALDFDSGISIEEVKKQLEVYNIIPNVIYESFSSTEEHPKFRIVMFCDQVVTDIKVAKYISEGLTKLFPNSDSSCKDLARYYFGGKNSRMYSVVVIGGNLNSISNLITAVSTVLINDTNFSKKYENMESLYNIYNNSIFQYFSHIFGNSDKELVKIENLEEKLILSVNIFRDFAAGRWLSHMQLFGLATNLLYINGGLMLMKTIMNKYNAEGKTSYTQNNYNILKVVKYYQYQPQSLSQYSPYESDFELVNCIFAVTEPRGFVKYLDSPSNKQPLITVEEARSLMETKFLEVLENDGVKIHLFVLPTGIGKTEMLTNLKSDSSVIVSFPTHKLLSEVSERYKTKDFKKTPKIPEFTNISLNRQINHLYSIGRNEKVYGLLHKVANNKLNGFLNSDQILAKDYLFDLENSKTDKLLLTTHQRSILTDFKQRTMIFDEDPLESLISIKTIDLRDLDKIDIDIQTNDEIRAFKQCLLNIDKGVAQKTPKFVFSINSDSIFEVISCSDISSNFVAFLDSDYIIRDAKDSNIIHYATKKSLPNDKKIIILSATAPVEIYKMLFGSRLEIFELNYVESKGKIIQNTKRSFSRESLATISTKKLEKMVDLSLPTITFKNNKKIKNGVKDIYFGKMEGFDELNNKDINVIGTPHSSNIVYYLYAKILGFDLKFSDLSMEYQTINRNNMQFKFMTYSHAGLRDIQLSLIESELVQAVGRSRTLNNNSTVYLYSNYPLLISTTIIW